MNYQINSIKGIEPEFSTKLNKAGINTVEDLLTKGSDPQRRHKLAAESGCQESTLLKWVGMADLFRVSGVSSQYAELFSACGINSVNDLASRKPDKILKKMKKVNQTKNICKLVPQIQTIENFVQQAQELPKIHLM